jgi:hypothetical protein
VRDRPKFSPTVTRAGVALAVLLVVSVLGLTHRPTIPRSNEPLASSTVFCTSSTEISLCPAVIAVPKAIASQRQVSRFLINLWNINASAGPPILGRYGLLRCENPGPSPYQVTCVFSSKATAQEASSLKGLFESSRLFRSVRLVTANLFVSYRMPPVGSPSETGKILARLARNWTQSRCGCSLLS